jgi:threonine dehydrogenase-like Zn-dependent dehydrogenase
MAEFMFFIDFAGKMYYYISNMLLSVSYLTNNIYNYSNEGVELYMKAFAMLGIGKTGWIEKEKPKCGPMDAICRPIALAPCTSDVHTVWEGAIGERHDMVLGHEAVGEVVEVGNMVKDFIPGDKVIVPAITPDWNSLEAQAGYQMHSGGMLAGWKFSNFKDGVFAEYFHVNDADGNLAILPEGMDPAAACMLSDMVPTGFHGVELADIQFGDTVVVVGIGPVGLMAVAGASLRGAGRLFAVGSRPNCVKAAKEYGATDIINYHEGDIVDQIMGKTNGKGVDRIVIAGGNVDTFAQAVSMLKPGGRIGNVNYLGEGDYIKIPRVEWGCGMGHKTIVGGLMPGGRLRMEKLASLIVNGRLDTSKLVTHRFDGLDKVEEALMLMKDKPKDLIKPVVLIK